MLKLKRLLICFLASSLGGILLSSLIGGVFTLLDFGGTVSVFPVIFVAMPLGHVLGILGSEKYIFKKVYSHGYKPALLVFLLAITGGFLTVFLHGIGLVLLGPVGSSALSVGFFYWLSHEICG